MNEDIPSQFNPLASPSFPMRQLKKLHRELTSFEIFIQMSARDPGQVLEGREKVKKIYEVQEMVEEYVAEESERLKIIRGR